MSKFEQTLVFTFLSIGSVLVADCHSSEIYNTPSSGTSNFDGSKYIRINKMRCNSIMFNLYQDTAKSKRNLVLLSAGSVAIKNIANGESLQIKLDKEIFSFKSEDKLTTHETYQLGYGATLLHSYKTYLIPEDFIEKVSKANMFLARIHFLNNTFTEEKCSPLTLQEAKEQSKHLNIEITQENVDEGNKYAAINGFRKFYNMMKKTFQNNH